MRGGTYYGPLPPSTLWRRARVSQGAQAYASRGHGAVSDFESHGPDDDQPRAPEVWPLRLSSRVVGGTAPLAPELLNEEPCPNGT
jgi:hypothetical protein